MIKFEKYAIFLSTLRGIISLTKIMNFRRFFSCALLGTALGLFATLPAVADNGTKKICEIILVMNNFNAIDIGEIRYDAKLICLPPEE